MQVIQKAQAVPYKNSTTCTAYEYPLKEKVINGAVIELSGRYPKTGQVVNAISKELIYVIRGSGKCVIEDHEVMLHPGDQLLIQPEERYYFDGDMDLYIACTPAWSPEQYTHHID